jgi:hypothetical protein
MGGAFSGYRWSKKRVVESCTTIDTSDLRRWNLLVPDGTSRAGAFHWSRGGEDKPSSSVSYRVTVGPNGGTLRLLYAIKSLNAELDYAVQLVTTPCHLGGVRWWFLCPLTKNGVACGRRVRKLFLSGEYFGCRRCHDLVYRSSQESDSRVYVALRSGAYLRGCDEIEGMSVSQLGFTLKVLTAGQKRLERLGKRLDRLRRGREEPGTETDS